LVAILKHVEDLALQLRQIVLLYRCDLLIASLLSCVDGCEETLDEDEHLNQEHFPEQVVFELKSEKREMGQVLGVLLQDLGVPFINMLDWFLVEAP
jgi:hypothetical protein